MISRLIRLAVLTLVLLSGSALAYTLSGTVRSQDTGNGVSGVTITLSGASSTSTTTSATGYWSITGLNAGTYTITPSRTSWTFSPTSQTKTISTLSISAIDFTAIPTQTTYSISGYISRSTGGYLGGVAVSLSGAASKSTTTDSGGYYIFSGLQNGSYTVTPSYSGWTFTPGSRSVSISSASQSNVDFTATASVTYSISGYVTNSAGAGMNGISVSLTGAASKSTTTGSDGYYNFTGLQNGSYTVTPSYSGWTFTPGSRSVSISGASQSSINFTATQVVSYGISGYVTNSAGAGMYGVTVSLSGAASKSTTTGSDGYYNFTGLQNGSYTVTPAYSGWNFTPASRSVAISGASQANLNFSGSQPVSYSISGTVTNSTGGAMSGVTMSLSGAASSTTSTGTGGYYNFTGLQNGSYTVTPSYGAFIFTPASRTMTISGASQGSMDFTGCQGPTITGQPADVSLTGPGTATLSVTATGSSLSYQWYQGTSGRTSNPISGANAASYTTPTLTVTTTYWVRVNGGCGSVDSRTATVTVPAGQPDLLVTALSGAPRTVLVGGSLAVTVSARNQGSVAAGLMANEARLSGNTSTGLFDGTLIGNLNSSGIAATTTVTLGPSTFTLPGGVTPGRYYLKVKLDVGGTVTEADENNNVGVDTTPIDVCSAVGITTQPVDVTLAGPGTATLTVVATGSSLSYQWYRGTAGDTSSPASGATSVSFTTPSLTATTGYWVRVSNLCGSVDSRTATVTVPTPQADLLVTTLSGTPRTVLVGGTLTVSFSIRNQGSVAAGLMANEIRLSGNTSPGLFDGTAIGNLNSPGIAAVTTANFGPTAFTLPAGVTPGRYYLKVKTDAAGTVVESDENNNIGVDATPIDVTAGTGNLNVAVKTVGQKPPQDGTLVTCKLYTSGWAYVDGQDKTGDSAGVCRWQGIPAASYYVEAYYNGISAFPGAEFWGSTYPAVVVAAGGSKDEILTRSWPYGEILEFRQGSATGPVLAAGASVTAGQPIWIGLKATQGTGGAVTANGRIALSLDQSTSAYESGDLAAQTMPSGVTTTFGWSVTPTQAGTYYAALRVQSQINGKWVKTDGWRWFPALVVTAPCVGSSDQLWQTLSAPEGTYSIRIVTRSPIADSNRALSETADGTNLRAVYVVDGQGAVVKAPLASELLLLAQSAKKYAALHQTDPGFWEAIPSGDLQRVARTPFGGSSYEAWRPYAVADWWASYFIFADKTALPALDSATQRTKVYKQVLLDLALQPDVSDAVTEDREAREWLEAWREGLETAEQIAGAREVVEAMYGVSDEIVNAASLAAFHKALREGSIPTRMRSSLHAKFDKLGTKLSALSIGVNLYSDVVRYLYLQALANVAAEQRLDALAAMIRRRPDFDPALTAALAEAEAELSALEAATYDEILGPAIGEAALDNVVEMVELGTKIGHKLVGKAFEKIALPYFLSWEVYKGIREQTDAAQEATAAATLVELMTVTVGQDEYDRSRALLSTGSYSLMEARDALNLLNTRYYLAWYFYGKYLDITANGLTWLWGRGIDFLGIADYSGFIDYLESERERTYDACVVTSGPAYLAKHARGLQRSAADSEKQFLLSRLRFDRPSGGCEPFDPEIAIEAGQMSGPAPLALNVRGKGAPAGASWTWTFGDGSQAQGEDPPSHSYASPGAYLLSATVVYSGVTKRTPPLAVLVSAPPVTAAFNADPRGGTAPLTVVFTDTSTGPVLSRRWEFGDGSSATEKNPVHSYKSAGAFNVSLTVYGPDNASTLRRVGWVSVSGATGDLEVNLNVAAPVRASGEVTAQGSGPKAVFGSLPAGVYQVRYGPLSGYECPADESISVVSGQRTVVSRSCSPASTPRLEASPGEVSFGYVEPGGSLRRSVLLKNSGGGELTGSATAAAPFRIVSGSPFALAAGASREIVMELAPSVVGDWTSSLNVSSNAGAAAVALSGGSRCGQPPSPMLSVPGVVVSGVPFVVSWSAVASAEGYDLEEADNAAFIGASTTTTTGLSVGLTRTSTTPLQIYFRVRSKRTCAGTNVVSEWAATGVCSLTTIDVPLSVWKAGTGEGTVWSDPGGILCSPTCIASFPPSELVTLTAVANAGSRFVGWSGDCTGRGSCIVEMTQARGVTAEFALDASPACFPVEVIANPAAGGFAERENVPSCTGGDDAGTAIPIQATPSSGFTFSGWTAVGCSLASATSPSTTCTVSGTGAVTIVGNFISTQGGSSCDWSTAADMPTARTGSPAAIAVVRGKISVIGSHDGNPGAGTYNEEYDPSTNTWKSNTAYPRGDGRYGQGSDAVVGDSIYLIGGTNIWGNYNTQTVDTFNPVTNTWTLDLATYPAPVSGLATASWSGKIYCFGGGPYGGRAYTNAYKFDTVAKSFTALPAMPTARYWAKAFVVDGKIWVAGGFDAYPFEVKATIDVFDPVTETWSSGPALPRTVDETNWVGITAGGDIHAVYDDGTPVVYRLDRQTGTWVPLCTTNVAQLSFGVTTVSSKLHFIGGGDPKMKTHQVLDSGGASASGRLVLSRQGNIWLTDTNGGSPIQLTSGGADSKPRLANGVVTFARSGSLYKTDTAGATPVLVSNSANVLEYDLKPDGSKIVLTHTTNWNFDLYTMNVDGSGKVRINAQSNMHQLYPGWGRDGFIYFGQSVFGDAYSQKIHRIPEGGVDNPARLVDYFTQMPMPGGPNGRVAFFYNQPAPKLRLMNADGTGQVDVPNTPAGLEVGKIGGFDYSDDVVYYVYASNVYRVRTDGTDLRQLTTTGDVTGADYGTVPGVAPMACFPLAALANPSAGGTVTVSTAQDCGTGYTSGKSVSLVATVGSGMEFAGWNATGCALSSATATSTSCNVSGTGPAVVIGSFRPALVPSVSRIVPNASPAAGGITVTITGSGFNPGVAVTFGGTPATGLVHVSETTIRATVPAHAAGVVDVVVTNPGQQAGTFQGGFYYSPPVAGTRWYPLAPCRVFDTRNASGPLGGPVLAAQEVRQVDVVTTTPTCGIPSDAISLTGNITVDGPTVAGEIRLYASDTVWTGTSVLSFRPGRTRANNAILKLSSDRSGLLKLVNASGGTVHAIFDVNGYFR